MAVDVAIDTSSMINNFDTLKLEIVDGAVQISVEYTQDDWDDIRGHQTEDVIAKLEAALKKFQTSACLGRHPVRYSQVSRPTPLCDLTYVLVTLLLADKEEADAEAAQLLSRLSNPRNLLHIPPDEINLLRNKLGKSKKNLYSSPRKHRWQL